MKIQFKHQLKNLVKNVVLLSTVFVFATSAHAQFSISDVVKSIIPVDKEVATPTKSVEKIVLPVGTTTQVKAKEKEVKTACEYYSDTVYDTLTLETASMDARVKIEKIEETIDTESSVRESILDSIKNIIGLKQNDKVIFREMKKDIDEANNYYDSLDIKVDSNQRFLDENFCENVKVTVIGKLSKETADLVDDEVVYRKQFASSLKDKMKILQDGVKNAKK